MEILAALLRLWICLPSTYKLFTHFKRRYSRSQISELNLTCKWRGQRILVGQKRKKNENKKRCNYENSSRSTASLDLFTVNLQNVYTL